MSYIVQRVCEFNGVTYFIGDTIPDGVIQEDAAKRLLRMGWIRVDSGGESMNYEEFLAMAKGEIDELKQSGGVGYADKKVFLDGVFEWDETYSIVTNITDIKVGDTVKVTWNGVEYTCVVYEFDNGDGLMFTAFGNTAMGGYGEDNGVPFAHVIMPNENGDLISGFIPTTDDVTESVSIKVTTEKIGTIDPKYLPGVCLPVVEIANVEAITAGENATLTACIGSPVIIKFADATLSIASVASYMYGSVSGSAVAHMFALLGPAGIVILRSADGVAWELK